ncbi:hypothetical protein Tsubulata_012802, partial [Turnera subulata]
TIKHLIGDGCTDKVGKPRRRLVKKSGGGGGGGDSGAFPEQGRFEREERKRKKLVKENKEKRKFVSGGSTAGGGGKKSGSLSKRRKLVAGKDDGEVKEMWDTIVGGDSQGVMRTVDDDNFIDDTGVVVDTVDRDTDAPQGEEEDEEIKQMFQMGKKRKKNEKKNPAEVALLVETVMAELEVAAEEDAELNRQGKPAINKLMNLPLLTEVLSKKQLQQEFIDHGVLTLLKNWLEPLPDGSLPNINIRAAILQILTDLPIDLEQYDRREQLKKSGLGKETTPIRKLAKELVDKWSRPIFSKSTRFEDMRDTDDEDRGFRRQPTVRRPVTNNSGGMETRDGDLDLDMSRKSGQSSSSSSRQHASRPEATPLDFMVRPQSKIDPQEARPKHDQRHQRIFKKLLQLNAPRKRQLQATKLSAEGRGMLLTC